MEFRGLCKVKGILRCLEFWMQSYDAYQILFDEVFFFAAVADHFYSFIITLSFQVFTSLWLMWNFMVANANTKCGEKTYSQIVIK